MRVDSVVSLLRGLSTFLPPTFVVAVFVPVGGLIPTKHLHKEQAKIKF